MKSRLARLRDRMRRRGLAALLVTAPVNRRYLSGFSGSAGWLLVTSRSVSLLVDFRYWERAAREAPECRIVRVGPATEAGMTQALAREARRLDLGEMGFEACTMTVAQHGELSSCLGPVEMAPTQGLVEAVRAVKEPGEIRAIARCAGMADRAFARVRARIRPGIREAEVARLLVEEMRREGAAGEAFDTIVASGNNSALPHHRTGSRVLKNGEFVILDFGASCGAYQSDVTRTLFLGRPQERHRDLYRVVLAAQRAAIRALRPGARCGDVDQVARGILHQAGCGEHFGHSLGHGVGLAVHEEPRLRPGSDQVLEEGMVVTVEPGVYLPGVGGVRIEDLLVVTRDGSRSLTRAPRENL